MSNEVVVGVKRIAGSTVARPDEEARGAIQAHWVTIGGVKVPGVIVSVATKLDGEGFHTALIEVAYSEFRTTDFDGPERPE